MGICRPEHFMDEVESTDNLLMAIENFHCGLLFNEIECDTHVRITAGIARE